MTDPPMPTNRSFAKTAQALCLAWLITAAPSALAQPAAGEADIPRTYYLFSLTETEIGEVATAVLGETLTYPFSIDEAVTGKMTFRVADPLSEDELLERFAAALAERDVALVRADGALKLTPRAAAMAQRPALDIIGVTPPVAAPPMAAPSMKSDVESATVLAPEKDGRDGRGWILGLAILLAGVGAALALGSNRTRVVEIRRRRTAPARSPSHAGTRDAVIDALLTTQPVGLAVLAEACDRAAAEGRPVEQVLYRQGAVSDRALAEAYAAVGALDMWDPVAQPPLRAPLTSPALEGFANALRTASVVLVTADDWSVTVATPDPFDDEAFNALCRGSRRMVTLLVARWSDIDAARIDATGVVNDDIVEGLGPLRVGGRRREARGGAALLQDILARNAAAPEGSPP